MSGPLRPEGGDPVLQALAFVARRQGRRTMPAGTWQNVLSLELGWMPPGQARSFVARAAEAGLLQDDEDGLRLSVAPDSVVVPRGFRPDPDAVPAQPPREDLFLVWARRTAAHQGVPLEEVLGEVAATQERYGGLLTGDAAVLLVAAAAGLDVTAAAAEALATLTAVPVR